MLRSVLAKSLFEHRTTAVWTSLTLSAWLLLTMGVYRSIDTQIYDSMPEAMRQLMGIPEGADAAALSYSVMLNFTSALALAGVAISIGAASMAGEERDGTIGILLANPVTRTRVLASKAAALAVVVALVAGALWGAGRAVPVALGVEIGDTHLAAMMLHLAINSVLYGWLAMVVGAWTGNRTLASGASAAAMILSYFAVGLLPLIQRIGWAAKAFPWYYFNGGDPLANGIQWDHLAGTSVGLVTLFLLSIWGINRRDLQPGGIRPSLLRRLRGHPGLEPLAARLGGPARVSRLWVKTASKHRWLVLTTSVIMFAPMGVLMGPMYLAMDDTMALLADGLPDEVLALSGVGDLSTPEGWFQMETFSIMAPLAVMVVTITIGARAVAGEERNRTMGLLLANPVRRRTVIGEQALAMVACGLAVGASVFVGVAVANLTSRLAMSYTGIAATSLLASLLGLVFGALAATIGAATGRVKLSGYGATGAAVTSHLANSYLPLSGRLAEYASWTPHHYFLGSDPLNQGMHWGHGAILTGLILALTGISALAFDHRDLR